MKTGKYTGNCMSLYLPIGTSASNDSIIDCTLDIGVVEETGPDTGWGSVLLKASPVIECTVTGSNGTSGANISMLDAVYQNTTTGVIDVTTTGLQIGFVVSDGAAVANPVVASGATGTANVKLK